MKYLLVVAILLSVACSSNKKEITGTYTSDVPKIGMFFNNYISGSSLKLNPDSTFTRKDCGQTTQGHWSIKKDYLYLYCEDMKYNVDSMNVVYGYEKEKFCNTKPDVMVINGNLISAKRKKKGGDTLYDRLKKITKS